MKTTVCARPLLSLALDGYNSAESVQPILEALLTAGANINARDERNSNWTPLMHAAFSKRTALVKYLLSQGANTALKEANGRTVFGLIDSKNDWNYNAVKGVLVESTEDGKAWLETTAGKGWRRANAVDDKAPIPVMRAETSRVLQDALKAEESEQLARIVRWIESGGNLDWRATNGWTLLHLAAQCGNEKIIRLLLSRGANIEALDEDKGTPLMLACNTGFSGKLSSSVVALLLDRGANPNAKDQNGNTALSLIRSSRINEAEKIAQLLMNRGSTSTPGKDSPCPDCGAPFSEDMARRDVMVTFQGAFAEFGCLECNKKQQAPLEAIDKGKGVQVRCSCGTIALIPASAWCKACGKGLSTDWQRKITKVR